MVKICEMKRDSQKYNTNLTMINYESSYYDLYKHTCCYSYYEVSMQNNIDPFDFYSNDKLLEKAGGIFMLIKNNELIGAVEIDKQEITHLFVNNKFKKRGYGKRLLEFAVNHIYEEGYNEDILFVVDTNTIAKHLYLKNNFVIQSVFHEEW
ncbi:GNAT family N-acetyltransferase [Amphibacillus sp. Q70]|uniref:GNAT family N-acetyltransferase n=1 Tax=Amphibacillus sp. Q70 TaxID=3453416 RepID=UPI003F85DDB6